MFCLPGSFASVRRKNRVAGNTIFLHVMVRSSTKYVY